MTCLDDYRTWLFRDNKEKIHTYSIHNDQETDTSIMSKKTEISSSGATEEGQQVVHLVTVLLPDIVP
eukprot:CAMPEP_0178843450 /NCGR_PEP_ID=MMETSP0746-20121128/16160_1 /TAXON_ID=913974 /ORGANISM="Nitzschia punctata, Strain CCMP561" /LENGTH=66 /DNA_ID=CAMNT_0020507079 /DNA_START=48 /DNA_END=244 /DNA_ORIENTATION=-